MAGPAVALAPGDRSLLAWTVPETDGAPIAAVGLELGAGGAGPGSVYLDFLTWEGVPTVILGRPREGGSLWRRAWVTAVDQFGEGGGAFPYRLIQNAGCGMVIQGAREWTDLGVEARICPHLAAATGLAVRVQGLRRYYALLLAERGRARLVRVLGATHVLGEAEFSWEFDRPYALALAAQGRYLSARVDGQLLFAVTDPDPSLDGGAIGLICAEGHVEVGPVGVTGARTEADA